MQSLRLNFSIVIYGVSKRVLLNCIINMHSRQEILLYHIRISVDVWYIS